MFKKELGGKSQQRLSGVSRKKLKRTIKERFPNVSDADIDFLLPPKVEVTVCKYSNRVLVYGLENDCPMFFDSEGRGSEIFPTVYTLWKFPDLLPAFVLKSCETSTFVLGGADLMFPGIQIPDDGFPSFSAGEMWAVKVPRNPAPIAVGTTNMSREEGLNAGLRGKALRIIHYYRDALWASAESPFVPNAGFSEGVVFEDPSLISAIETSESGQDNQIPIEKTNPIDVEDGAPSQYDSRDSNVTEMTSAVSDLQLDENAAISEGNTDEQHSLTTEEVDMLLDQCFLQALHTTVKPKDLPIPGSTLWSSHVLPCRPSGVTLDIKKSSYKKVSKWLQSKAATGLITVKEDKYTKELKLCSVNLSHPDYSSFKAEKTVVDQPDQCAKPAAANDRSEPVDKLLIITEMYKPSSHVNPIFSATGADTSKLYTASEASEVVFGYVEQEKLAKPENKSTVVLDVTLCDALFKGAVKKGSAYPTEIHKKDLGPAFVGRMQAHHVVSRGGDAVARKGPIKPIQMLTERRGGNKKVTRLSGVESFLIDPETLASELQRKFACSTTISELPGKKGMEVLVQGGVIDDLGRHLVVHYGVDKRYIEVLDKTKKN